MRNSSPEIWSAVEIMKTRINWLENLTIIHPIPHLAPSGNAKTPRPVKSPLWKRPSYLSKKKTFKFVLKKKTFQFVLKKKKRFNFFWRRKNVTIRFEKKKKRSNSFWRRKRRFNSFQNYFKKPIQKNPMSENRQT